ncbi:lipocalin family protein [Lysobacter enzymogenes]|uniref:lipocalin family protein n=1 Tax=Lysobacter enzymogenes TaxID=69 RepID=UPI001AF2412A|nr:lipocalin family protein [Lysobacter enzymogenes]QQQ00862.1 lipocalin family protein [Lysobacter enzymogenes]
MNSSLRFLAVLILIPALGSCASQARPMPPVESVDLPRFMGDWYVIAHIPSRPEREAFDAVESYRLDEKGRVLTTFTFRKGSHDAPIETMHPTGFVKPGTGNAVWGMQFIWPIKAEYVIAYLDENYTRTIVARSKRDYAWIMARSPQIPEQDYAQLVERLRELGYSTTDLRKVPQARSSQDSPKQGSK